MQTLVRLVVIGHLTMHSATVASDSLAQRIINLEQKQQEQAEAIDLLKLQLKREKLRQPDSPYPAFPSSKWGNSALQWPLHKLGISYP